MKTNAYDNVFRFEPELVGEEWTNDPDAVFEAVEEYMAGFDRTYEVSVIISTDGGETAVLFTNRPAAGTLWLLERAKQNLLG